MKPMRVVFGVLLVLTGAVWGLQGVGVIQGSAMSDTTTWSVIGPIVVVLGVLLALTGLRGRRRS